MNNRTKETLLLWMPLFLILYNFCANLANDIYLPSMPILAQFFHAEDHLLQLTMTAWFAGVALPQLFFGPLTDRFGRRPVLFTGGICFLISTLICASANQISTLIVARFFQGMGVCSLNVATFGIVSDLYNYQSRTKILNKINICGTLAPLIGPVIGGYVLAYIGWRSNFIIIFILGLISLIGLKLTLPESNPYLNPYALNIINIYKSYLLLLKNKIFLKHLLPYCLLLGALVAYLTGAPFIIISKLGIAPQWFGFTQFPVFGAYVAGALYLHFTKEESVIRKLLKYGIIICFIAACLLVISSYFFQENLWLFILPVSLFALGFSLCGGPLISEVMSAATLAKGSGAAFLGFGMALSCMLSSFFVGILYNGTIISLAILLFIIIALANLSYFLQKEMVTEV